MVVLENFSNITVINLERFISGDKTEIETSFRDND